MFSIIKKYKKSSRLLSSLFALIIALQPVQVFAIDEYYYSGNDILFYNPDAQCVTKQNINNLSGGDNEEKTWNYFIGKGLTEKQTAGIIGNLQIEAPGIDPSTNQGGGGPGRGIVQWTVTERWASLLKWKGERNEFDLQTQLDFIWYELYGSEKSAYDAFIKTDSIRDATDVWMKRYERPGTPHFERRLAAANEAYGKYSKNISTPLEGTDLPVSSTSAPSNGCVSTSNGDGSIVSIAQQELAKGVKEQPVGCDAGNPSRKGDCGAEVNKYTDNTLEYWCADFVSWVYKEAGKPFTGGVSGGWRLPGVAGVKDWFNKNGTYTQNSGQADPKPGDIYTLRDGSGLFHIGIVEKVEGDTLYAISGNTSTDNTGNGNGVGNTTYKNFRSNTEIDGFGSLNG